MLVMTTIRRSDFVCCTSNLDHRGKREPMDTSPHSTSSTIREAGVYEPIEHEGDVEEAEPHIHVPNPSYWPVLLGLSIAVAIAGFLLISSAPWISIIALVFVLICILGWGLEDPMAPLKETYVTIRQKFDPWKFKIGQSVVDSQGESLGKVQARFPHYILVERAGIFSKVYYVPRVAAKDKLRKKTIYLTRTEADLQRMGLKSVPNDLYEEAPEHGF